MNISISGKNMDTGTAFQELAYDLLEAVISKYFKNAISGHITLEKSDAGFDVKIRVNLTNRIELESTGSGREANAALEEAIDHPEKRLRRHKRRPRNHRGAGADVPADVLMAPMAVYAGVDQQDNDDHAEDEAQEEALPIIAELSYEVECLTVEQAVMRLELSRDKSLLFRNAQHMGLNMVHMRADGTIGWVDPRGTRNMQQNA